MSNQRLEFQEIINWFESISSRLPTETAEKIKNGVNILLEGISAAISHFRDETDCCQKIQKMINLAEQSATREGKAIDPFLQQIKLLLSTSLTREDGLEKSIPSSPNSSTTTVPEIAESTSLVESMPLAENTGTAEPTETGVDETDGLVEEHSPPLSLEELTSPTMITSKKEGGKKLVSSSQKSEEECRTYCWELATYSGPEPEKFLKEKIKIWGKAPSARPRQGDVVIHGTVFNSTEKLKFSPTWIGPTERITGFDEFITKVLPQFKEDGQIWLSFANLSDGYTAYYLQPDVVNKFALETPQWCIDHEGTLPLWCRWLDLLGWAWLAPEAYFFAYPQHETLSQNREAICNTLLELHAGFRSELTKPTNFYLAKELHKAYSAFYRFLLPADLQISKSPAVKQAFSILQKAVREDVEPWWQFLQIEELRGTGVLTNKILFGGLKDLGVRHKNDSRIAPQHPFLQQAKELGRLIESSQVLYWLQPGWKLKGLSSDRVTELDGSVLYCSDN